MTHRKHSHAFGTITLTVTACLLLWGFQLPAWAGDATQVEPLALRKIMQRQPAVRPILFTPDDAQGLIPNGGPTRGALDPFQSRNIQQVLLKLPLVSPLVMQLGVDCLSP